MSNQSRPILTLNRVATATLAACRFISPTGANPTGAGNVLGIIPMPALAIGDRVPVVVQGTAPMECSAAIADGALIEVLADGRGVTKTAGIAVARALEAGAGAGSVIEVLLLPN